jgi:acyl-CoA thioester hydrolase
MEGFHVIYESPIAWGDMDAFGHVNNTVFFRLFESARMEYLQRIDFMGTNGSIGPILAATNCRFRRPIMYPDTVRVGARVSEVQSDRFTMEYVIVKGAGEVAAEGSGTIVAYDYQAHAKALLPTSVRDAIRAIEGL